MSAKSSDYTTEDIAYLRHGNDPLMLRLDLATPPPVLIFCAKLRSRKRNSSCV